MNLIACDERGDGVLFVERSSELICSAWLICPERRSHSESEAEQAARAACSGEQPEGTAD